MTLTMFDSADLSQIPADPPAVACYVDGRFANSAQARDRFPHARILTIAVFAEHDADCLDIETGDATPAQAAAWYTRQRARGLARPCLYASASVMEAAVLPVLKAAGIPVSSASLRLWSAHYTHKPHICGPSSCGAVSAGMDGTQWTDRALGRNLDQSLLADGFFAAQPEGWTARMITDLPVLKQGAQDKPGHVFMVRRLQALAVCYGRINGLAAAACLAETGTFDGPTAAAVKAVQAHKKLTQDGIVGPQTWGVLIAGNPA